MIMKANFEYINSVLSVNCININASYDKIELALSKIYGNICKFIETICLENDISCKVTYTEKHVCITINYILSNSFRIRIKPKTANLDNYSFAINKFNSKLDYLNRYEYAAHTKIKSLNSKLTWLKRELSLAKYPINTAIEYEIDDVKNSIKTQELIIGMLGNEITNLIAKGIIVN